MCSEWRGARAAKPLPTRARLRPGAPVEAVGTGGVWGGTRPRGADAQCLRRGGVPRRGFTEEGVSSAAGRHVHAQGQGRNRLSLLCNFVVTTVPLPSNSHPIEMRFQLAGNKHS